MHLHGERVFRLHNCTTAKLQNWKNAKITQIIETCASTLKLAAALPHKSLLKSEKKYFKKKVS